MKTKFYAYEQETSVQNDDKGLAKIVIIECQQKEESLVKLKKLGYEWTNFDESYSLQYLKYNIEMRSDIGCYFVHFYDGKIVKEDNF